MKSIDKICGTEKSGRKFVVKFFMIFSKLCYKSYYLSTKLIKIRDSKHFKA